MGSGRGQTRRTQAITAAGAAQPEFYNTMTRRKEVFKTRVPGKVQLFVCGPTVYDLSHLGHAKTYIYFDFLARYLKRQGYEVEYVQNITDIDDKIIARARELGVSPSELAAEYEGKYLEDMESLNIGAVTQYARAHDYVDQIVDQIKRLLDKGFAYKTSDGVYFDLSKFTGYGKLSGRTSERRNDAVSRVDHSDEKRSPQDFALRKNKKEGEPFWETELGAGRPGWHIEDTAITESVFGPQYDLHGGAVDLIFPHHEAEIAQIEAVSGKQPMVAYWQHTGFLTVDGEKMSKSAGNYVTIRDALKEVSPETLRYLFLSNHYRSPVDYSAEKLQEAEAARARLQNFVRSVDAEYDDVGNEELTRALARKIDAALAHDLDTPAACACMFDFVREQNKQGKPGKRARKAVEGFNGLFGVLRLGDDGGADLPLKLRELAQQRQKLRSSKRFQEADEVRERARQAGYVLEDVAGGIRWRSGDESGFVSG